MTPEQQRIAIAEVCGWTQLEIVCNEPEPDVLAGYHPDKQPHGKGGLDYVKEQVPDYLSDLNAMHEAWKTCILNKQNERGFDLQISWRHELKLICLRDVKTVGFNSTSNATAAQRAEAFLRTLGKWEEPTVDGPSAEQCNDILGKPGHY